MMTGNGIIRDCAGALQNAEESGNLIMSYNHNNKPYPLNRAMFNGVNDPTTKINSYACMHTLVISMIQYKVHACMQVMFA